MLAKALLGARSQLLNNVGEVIPVGSLRPIWTAHETVGGRTLERPSCGGFVPTAETTLLPAYSATSKILLTGSARLDNEPKFGRQRYSVVSGPQYTSDSSPQVLLPRIKKRLTADNGLRSGRKLFAPRTEVGLWRQKTRIDENRYRGCRMPCSPSESPYAHHAADYR